MYMPQVSLVSSVHRTLSNSSGSRSKGTKIRTGSVEVGFEMNDDRKSPMDSNMRRKPSGGLPAHVHDSYVKSHEHS
jgi:hypothetical protein